MIKVKKLPALIKIIIILKEFEIIKILILDTN